MEPDEILLAVRLPKVRDDERSFFFKVGTRRAQAISKVVMAMKAQVADGTIKSIGIGLGSVAPTVIRATRTEKLLTGAPLGRESLQQACQMISEDISPITDMRSTEHYRRTVTGKMLAKLLFQLQ
jgi:xanthine dehydrogenase iron-sulfur cluster and FAD-binding subunit A